MACRFPLTEEQQRVHENWESITKDPIDSISHHMDEVILSSTDEEEEDYEDEENEDPSLPSLSLRTTQPLSIGGEGLR